MQIKTKRVYDEPAPEDGYRVLVDRLWPRGLSKDKARIDWWPKQIAPSTELRKWFGHAPERFDEFAARYRLDLAANPKFEEFRQGLAVHPVVTLLYAAHDTAHNQAVVLQQILMQR